VVWVKVMKRVDDGRKNGRVSATFRQTVFFEFQKSFSVLSAFVGHALLKLQCLKCRLLYGTTTHEHARIGFILRTVRTDAISLPLSQQ